MLGLGLELWFGLWLVSCYVQIRVMVSLGLWLYFDPNNLLTLTAGLDIGYVPAGPDAFLGGRASSGHNN